jgi:hypothetical protein
MKKFAMISAVAAAAMFAAAGSASANPCVDHGQWTNGTELSTDHRVVGEEYISNIGPTTVNPGGQGFADVTYSALVQDVVLCSWTKPGPGNTYKEEERDSGTPYTKEIKTVNEKQCGSGAGYTACPTP